MNSIFHKLQTLKQTGKMLLWRQSEPSTELLQERFFYICCGKWDSTVRTHPEHETEMKKLLKQVTNEQMKLLLTQKDDYFHVIGLDMCVQNKTLSILEVIINHVVAKHPECVEIVFPYAGFLSSLDVVRTVLDDASNDGKVKLLESYTSDSKQSILSVANTDTVYKILHNVCRAGCSEAVSLVLNILQESGNCTVKEALLSKNQMQETALHIACSSGDVETVEAILEKLKGHCPEVMVDALVARDDSNETPLHKIFRSGNHDAEIAMLEKLLECDNDVPVNDLLLTENKHEKEAVLHVACKSGNHQAIEVVLEKLQESFGDDSMKTTLLHQNVSKQTPMHIACLLCSADTVALMIDYLKRFKILGEVIKLKDAMQSTLLHYALMNKIDASVTKTLMHSLPIDLNKWLR